MVPISLQTLCTSRVPAAGALLGALLLAEQGDGGVASTPEAVGASLCPAVSAHRSALAGIKESIVNPGSEHHHHIDYIEFNAPQLPAIRAFYGSVFGWQFHDWGPDYIGFDHAGVTGGFHRGEPVRGAGPLVILFSADLEPRRRLFGKPARRF